jgi:hypothetical protein
MTMRQYQFGDTVDLRHEIRDADDELVDATAVLTLVAPDGTESEPGVSSGGTGLRDASFAVDQYGPYRFVWTVTGAVNDVARGQFYVADDDDELPPLISFGKLVNKLGYTPEDEERARAESILNEASSLIRDVAEKTWTNESTNALLEVPHRVRQIALAVVYRAFTNPEGLTQRTIGDSSKSFDRSKREGGEAVYLTAAEEAAIQKAAGVAGNGMVSVTLVSPYDAGSLLDPWDAVTAE